ncbi:uncharacterized protein RJT21DRAFT_21614 [Scheffersomyces amazonensis]|uniref:uncharacterized protein n=1 Tax=Scheffersomyces amazonensis TaxID=1078765 RepID=UPI00315C8B91
MIVDKETKYDRQLRLWASTGQSNLENSHICLINATTTGCEILKNLVLPGIGEFTIIDDRKVLPIDLSGNFFLKQDDIGRNIATAVKENLIEMNYEVKGNDIIKSIESILDNDGFWDTFNVVIVSDHLSQIDQLKEILWNKKIPLLIVHTIGFYGSLQLISNEITVIETHQSSKLYDLRIDTPWPELQEFVDSFEFDKLNDIEHAHIPSIVIHIKALNNWKLNHDNHLPKSRDERLLFKKDYISALSRNIHLEGNFIESVESFHRALRVTQIPSNLQELFNDDQISDENINLSTPIFWIYIKALRNFIELNNGLLPLPGALPDMESDTESYVALKSIYREKALKDQELFYDQVIKVLKSAGRYEDEISKDSIATFCKNAQSLYVSHGSKKSFTPDQIQQLTSVTSTPDSLLEIYFAIWAYDKYLQEFKVIPSINDIETVKQVLASSLNISEKLSPTFVMVLSEILNHNTHSYHNLSSFMGGIVSQEVLKLTTAQYIPLDNVFVFDGIHSKSDKWSVN